MRVEPKLPAIRSTDADITKELQQLTAEIDDIRPDVIKQTRPMFPQETVAKQLAESLREMATTLRNETDSICKELEAYAEQVAADSDRLSEKIAVLKERQATLGRAVLEHWNLYNTKQEG